ncbi:MAG: hypothetical protein K6A42_10320 [Treponema sp.]|nr:hypothetical protein [Treponema sp.]
MKNKGLENFLKSFSSQKRIVLASRIMALLLAAAFLTYGIARGEVQIVLQKAIRVCMECVGLG